MLGTVHARHPASHAINVACYWQNSAMQRWLIIDTQIHRASWWAVEDRMHRDRVKSVLVIMLNEMCYVSPEFRICLEFRIQNYSIYLAHRFLVLAPCSAYIPAELNICCTKIKPPGRTTPGTCNLVHIKLSTRRTEGGVLEMDHP